MTSYLTDAGNIAGSKTGASKFQDAVLIAIVAPPGFSNVTMRSAASDFLISIACAFFRGMLSSICTLIEYETDFDFSDFLPRGHFSHCPRHCTPNRIGDHIGG